MDFRSDNTAPCAPEIMEALASVNSGPASSYGEDELSRRLDAAFGEVFECEVRVFPVATGTAANAIALASAVPPWGAILCHREAHIECDEAGAPEFYSAGAKLMLLDGPNAKIDAPAVCAGLARWAGNDHGAQPAALSISQTSERGTVYSVQEMQDLGAAARGAKLAFHVDGARFANAAAAGDAPAALTWRAGVDLLSFGASKNGALDADAIVAFDLSRAEQIARRRKRGGHLAAKGRFAAAQLLAYLEGGLWLRLAARANALAQRLGEAGRAHLSAPVESNQVFLRLTPANLARLRETGVGFYDWGGANSGEARLVVSWSQPEDEVERLCALLAALE
jgi:threonine aldolase